jgi:hypothetical protein
MRGYVFYIPQATVYIYITFTALQLYLLTPSVFYVIIGIMMRKGGDTNELWFKYCTQL